MSYRTLKTKHGDLKLDADIYAEIKGKPLCFSGGYPYLRTKHPVEYNGYKCVAYALVALHRYVVRASETDHVDHRKGNKLDFRRSQLRKCTRAQNLRNRPKSKNNTSGFKGVRQRTRTSWWSVIMVNRKRIFLGCYNNPEVAARVYDKAALTHHKEFAWLNFPDDSATALSFIPPVGSVLSRTESKHGVGVYRMPNGHYYFQAPRKKGERSTTIASGFNTAKLAQIARSKHMEGLH